MRELNACAIALGFERREEALVSDIRIPREFEAMLPRLSTPVRISSFHDAMVFVRRWTIREKDLEVRGLLRRMQRANNSKEADILVGELKQKLATRGLLPAPPQGVSAMDVGTV
jgi:hypothetical protein